MKKLARIFIPVLTLALALLSLAGYIATSMVLGAKGEAHWFSDAVAGTHYIMTN